MERLAFVRFNKLQTAFCSALRSSASSPLKGKVKILSMPQWSRHYSKRTGNASLSVGAAPVGSVVTRARSFRTTASSQLLSKYTAMVESNELQENKHQTTVVEALDKLSKELEQYTPEPKGSRTPKAAEESKSFFGSIFGGKNEEAKPEETAPTSSNSDAPMGLYLYGDVGCGKTMLMDMFYDHLTTPLKRRTHFNAFMLDVHRRIHKFKQTLSKNAASHDPIPPLADDLAQEMTVVCFDEFQVTDVADAMILRRLFGELFDRGVVMVATSNRPPEDLYKGGLQRSVFLPFIDLLKEKSVVMPLEAAVDYREEAHKNATHKETYFSTSPEDLARVDQIFNEMTGGQAQPVTLHLQGREVKIPAAANGAARLSFDEVCNNPLGAGDYLKMIEEFHTIFVDNVPKMGIQDRDAARRFIVFIDCLYDAQKRVVVTAAASPKELFTATKEDVKLKSDDATRLLMDDLKLSKDTATASVFTGEDEIFAFRRTISRLLEMQTQDYWDLSYKE